VLVAASTALGQSAFPEGVASGDVTDTAAVCWTHTEAGEVRVDIATDPAFGSLLISEIVTATAAEDSTVKFEAQGLAASTRYYYRFVRTDTAEAGPTGTFTTAPPPDEPQPFRFVYSGDSNAADQPFHLLGHAVAEHPDFWVWAGDTIYSDIAAQGLGVVVDLPGYRAKYVQNRRDAFLQELSAASPVWAQWDDHEVANDYDGGDLEPNITPQRQAQAYQAFFEYMPIRPQDAAETWRTYRSFRYGGLAEFFILDCRQYRSRDVGRMGGGFDPRAFFLPTFELGTIIEIHNPSRTMLGAQQLQWLKDGLLRSTATWKFILSSVSFTSLLVYPQDRWDGYDAERYDLLRFIDTHGVRGVVLLSADIHGNIYNPDVTRFLRNDLAEYFSPGFGVPEFVTGPIATDTLQQEVEEIVASAFDRPAEQVDAVWARVQRENGLAFFEPDKYAYLVVDVRPDRLVCAHRGLPPSPLTDAPEPQTLNTATLPLPSTTCGYPCVLLPLGVWIMGALGLPATRRLAPAILDPRRRFRLVKNRRAAT
jgi:alkaline phosphatase D